MVLFGGIFKYWFNNIYCYCGLWLKYIWPVQLDSSLLIATCIQQYPNMDTFYCRLWGDITEAAADRAGEKTESRYPISKVMKALRVYLCL